MGETDPHNNWRRGSAAGPGEEVFRPNGIVITLDASERRAPGMPPEALPRVCLPGPLTYSVHGCGSGAGGSPIGALPVPY